MQQETQFCPNPRRDAVYMENQAPPILKGSLLHVYHHFRSKPTCWTFYLDKIAEAIGYCRTTVMRAIKKLRSLGILQRERKRAVNGRFDGFKYKVNLIQDVKKAVLQVKIAETTRYLKALRFKRKKQEEIERYHSRKPYISRIFTTGTNVTPTHINKSFTIDDLSVSTPKLDNEKVEIMEKGLINPQGGFFTWCNDLLKQYQEGEISKNEFHAMSNKDFYERMEKHAIKEAKKCK